MFGDSFVFSISERAWANYCWTFWIKIGSLLLSSWLKKSLMCYESNDSTHFWMIRDWLSICTLRF